MSLIILRFLRLLPFRTPFPPLPSRFPKRFFIVDVFVLLISFQEALEELNGQCGGGGCKLLDLSASRGDLTSLTITPSWPLDGLVLNQCLSLESLTIDSPSLTHLSLQDLGKRTAVYGRVRLHSGCISMKHITIHLHLYPFYVVFRAAVWEIVSHDH